MNVAKISEDGDDKILEHNFFYDATFQVLAPHRGMATYLNEFINALKRNEVLMTGLAPSHFKLINTSHIVTYGFRNILLWEQFSIPAFLTKTRVDAFIFPYNTGPVFKQISTASVLIVHDLIFMEPVGNVPSSRSLKQFIGRVYRRFTVPRIIRRASYIITVSEYSKQKITKRFAIDHSKVTVIPNSIDTRMKVVEETLERKYFLNVGGDAPHKNVVFLIRAYSKLPVAIKGAYSLKLVGISNKANKVRLLKTIRKLGEQENIFIEPFIDTEALIKLYRETLLFIFPSLVEGFGIPILEAMKYGCAIVSSNRSCLPEVCGNAAFYFDPTSIESCVEAITLALRDKAKRDLKIENASNQLEMFSRGNFEKKVNNWYNEFKQRCSISYI